MNKRDEMYNEVTRFSWKYREVEEKRTPDYIVKIIIIMPHRIYKE